MKTKHKTKSAKAAVMQTKFRPRVERDRKKYNRKVEKVAILGYN
jgi:stalled ribosome alternative rescue factor ArfA